MTSRHPGESSWRLVGPGPRTWQMLFLARLARSPASSWRSRQPPDCSPHWPVSLLAMGAAGHGPGTGALPRPGLGRAERMALVHRSPALGPGGIRVPAASAPRGLSVASWGALLADITLLACAVAWVRDRRGADGDPSRGCADHGWVWRSAPTRQLMLLIGAVMLVATALLVARVGVVLQPQPPWTALAIVSAEDGARSSSGSPTPRDVPRPIDSWSRSTVTLWPRSTTCRWPTMRRPARRPCQPQARSCVGSTCRCGARGTHRTRSRIGRSACRCEGCRGREGAADDRLLRAHHRRRRATGGPAGGCTHGTPGTRCGWPRRRSRGCRRGRPSTACDVVRLVVCGDGHPGTRWRPALPAARSRSGAVRGAASTGPRLATGHRPCERLDRVLAARPPSPTAPPRWCCRYATTATPAPLAPCCGRTGHSATVRHWVAASTAPDATTARPGRSSRWVASGPAARSCAGA